MSDPSNLPQPQITESEALDERSAKIEARREIRGRLFVGGGAIFMAGLLIASVFSGGHWNAIDTKLALGAVLVLGYGVAALVRVYDDV